MNEYFTTKTYYFRYCKCFSENSTSRHSEEIPTTRRSIRLPAEIGRYIRIKYQSSICLRSYQTIGIFQPVILLWHGWDKSDSIIFIDMKKELLKNWTLLGIDNNPSTNVNPYQRTQIIENFFCFDEFNTTEDAKQIPKIQYKVRVGRSIILTNQSLNHFYPRMKMDCLLREILVQTWYIRNR